MQNAMQLGQQVRPSVLSSAERIVKNLKVWLSSTNKVGSSVMEECVTNRQMAGATMIPVALVLLLASTQTLVLALPGIALMAGGSRMIQAEKGGAA
ncbi:MAG: hypothetical protein K5778_01745 [Bacteroidaceae bacterium]|nr:hypothetical protein [Bacteroidaceae bacterium]